MGREEPRRLTTDACDAYRKNGYWVVSDVLSTDQLEFLYEEMIRIFRGRYGSYNRWRVAGWSRGGIG